MADLSILKKRFGLKGGLVIAVLGLSMANQESQAFFGFDLDTALFNASLKTAQYSLKLAFKGLVRSPKMLALIVSIYFYKEILGFAKDTAGYIIGEFPYITMAGVLAVLLYVSNYIESHEMGTQ